MSRSGVEKLINRAAKKAVCAFLALVFAFSPTLAYCCAPPASAAAAQTTDFAERFLCTE